MGGSAGEELDLLIRSGRVGDDGPVSVDMGGGNDNVWVRSQDAGSVDGGPGKDWLRVEANGTTALVADLEREYFHLPGRDRTRIPNWERASFTEANYARVNGTDHADVLWVWGCGTTIRGRGGNDVLDGYQCDHGPRQGNPDRGRAWQRQAHRLGLPRPAHRRTWTGLLRLGGGGGDVCAVEIKEYCG